MFEGNEPTIPIPWPWIAGGITAIVGGFVAAIRYLFKIVIERHNAEIKSRDERRAEDSAVWKEAMHELAASNERAMASLGTQIGDAVARQIKESGKQQEDLIREVLQPKQRMPRK